MKIKTIMRCYLVILQTGKLFFTPSSDHCYWQGAGDKIAHTQEWAVKAIPLLQLSPREKS